MYYVPMYVHIVYIRCWLQNQDIMNLAETSISLSYEKIIFQNLVTFIWNTLYCQMKLRPIQDYSQEKTLKLLFRSHFNFKPVYLYINMQVNSGIILWYNQYLLSFLLKIYLVLLFFLIIHTFQKIIYNKSQKKLLEWDTKDQ